MRDHLLVLAVGLCALSGIFNPAARLFGRIVIQEFFPTFVQYPLMLDYAASLLGATAVLILSGIPAALYERFQGLEQSNGVSLAIWSIGAAVLGIPALPVLIGA